jgi:hypothetical protein
MSKEFIKAFLGKISDVEQCDTNKNDACNLVGELDENIDKMDLRFNKNKEKVLGSLDKLNNQKECFICGAADGISIELWDLWKRNKLNKNPKG